MVVMRVCRSRSAAGCTASVIQLCSETAKAHVMVALGSRLTPAMAETSMGAAAPHPPDCPIGASGDQVTSLPESRDSQSDWFLATASAGQPERPCGQFLVVCVAVSGGFMRGIGMTPEASCEGATVSAAAALENAIAAALRRDMRRMALFARELRPSQGMLNHATSRSPGIYAI